MILKKNSTPYIYILFFAFFVSNFYGQNSNIFHLKIKSNDTTENRVIKSIDYKKEFKHYKNLLKTKDSVFSFLKTNGFYTLFTETYQQNKDTYSYTINLGNQIKELPGKTNFEETKQLFLNGVLTESLDTGGPAYYNGNILSRYFRKDYYGGD